MNIPFSKSVTQLYLQNCNKKKKEKIYLRGLSIESFLAIWLSQYKFLVKWFLIM